MGQGDSKEDRLAKLKVEEKLIELVKERPLLWVKCHPDHCNASAKTNAWKRIFELLGTSKFVKSHTACKRLCRRIWDQYLGWKRKTKTTTGDGARKSIYYRHAENLRQFADKEFVERTYSNDSDSSEDDEEESTSPAVTADDLDEVELFVGNPSPLVTINEAVAVPAVINNADKVPTASTSQAAKPRSHSGQKRQSTTSGQEFEQELIDTFKKSNSDDFEAFSRSIAIKIRKHDDKNQSEAMFRIHETMYKIENDLWI